MGAWFSMLLGRKRFYMICVALFTVSSRSCAASRPSLGWLIFFRVMQGFGGGALQPISQAILVESFPRDKQGMAMAVYGMGVVVAPVIGPTLGGWITDNFSWGWIFFINIPVGILSLVMTSRADLRSALPGAQEFRRRAEGRLHRASACSPSAWARSKSCSTRASATIGSARTSSSSFAA